MEISEINLVELTEAPWTERWQALANELLSKHKIILKSEIRPTLKDNLRTKLEEVVASNCDICVVSQSLSQYVSENLSQVTHQSLQGGATDILIREQGGWWPRPTLEEAFLRSLSKYIGQIDFSSSALVFGTDGYSMMIVSALAKLGFSKINITDTSAQLGERAVSEMKRKYFKAEFNFIPVAEITTLPGIHSLFVNCVPLTIEEESTDELYFFNFMKSKGVVVDLNLVPSQTPLICEATQWGARHLSGEMILAVRDGLALERVLHKSFSVDPYTSALKSSVDAVPFDVSLILKRFRERGT